jgi:hypothetical protein
MSELKYIIAGKNEGFAYKDGCIVGPVESTEGVIDSLRSRGYKIFIITKEEKRIDDFVEGVHE